MTSIVIGGRVELPLPREPETISRAFPQGIEEFTKFCDNYREQNRELYVVVEITDEGDFNILEIQYGDEILLARDGHF